MQNEATMLFQQQNLILFLVESRLDGFSEENDWYPGPALQILGLYSLRRLNHLTIRFFSGKEKYPLPLRGFK